MLLDFFHGSPVIVYNHPKAQSVSNNFSGILHFGGAVKNVFVYPHCPGASKAEFQSAS